MLNTKPLDIFESVAQLPQTPHAIQVIQMDFTQLWKNRKAGEVSQEEWALWFQVHNLGFRAYTPEMTELARLATANLGSAILA